MLHGSMSRFMYGPPRPFLRGIHGFYRLLIKGDGIRRANVGMWEEAGRSNGGRTELNGLSTDFEWTFGSWFKRGTRDITTATGQSYVNRAKIMDNNGQCVQQWLCEALKGR